MSLISNSGHDERGKYIGGQAGDQSGTEWYLRTWYNRPWNCVLRHPDSKVRNKIAELAEKAARNDYIGYDQGERTTYWNELIKAGYDPSNIKNPCEADCSAGVMANIKAVGYLLNNEKLKSVTITSTHYMRNMLKNAGFQVLTDSKYLTSANYLERGDILLNDNAHTATNLEKGCYASGTSTVSYSKKDYWVLGDYGDEVLDIQKKLNKLGYNLAEDKSFGNATESAVIDFQRKNNLEVDGSCGPLTMAKLNELVSMLNSNLPTVSNTSGTLNKTPQWTGAVTGDGLNVRTWAGTENPNIKSYPIINKGNLVDVCDTVKDKNSEDWYYIRIAGKYYGFVKAEYIKRT